MKVQKRPGAFVISIDFEKHWGMFERVGPGDPYWANLIEEGPAVLKTLDMFAEYGTHCTWATVGLLFANNKEDQLKWRPKVAPEYTNSRLNPYSVEVGNDISDDTVHFSRDEVLAIARAPGQELATHTFGHIYCSENGMTAAAFEADIVAAKEAAKSVGSELRSIVFPRNQFEPEFLQILCNQEIYVYRGNPEYWPYNVHLSKQNLGVKLGRLIDGFQGSSTKPLLLWDQIWSGGMANVRASHFLRPYNLKLGALWPLHVRRTKACIRAAAEQGAIYHLWWHPHNFGANQTQNYAMLREILEEVKNCEQKYGLMQLTMQEAAEYCREA